MAFSHVKAYRISILHSPDLKIATTKDVLANEDTVGLLTSITNGQHILAKTLSAIPVDNTVTFGHDRLDWIDVATGKIDKSLSYKPARECDKLLESPDKKYLLGLFYTNPFNSHGESDYGPYKNTLEREGYVDVIDSHSGKILWHIEPGKAQPVGDPLFFISPTQFVSSDTLFDIASKTAQPWSAVNAERQCLAAVPGHASYALFWTKGGVELRNWKTDRTLQHWPSLTQKGRVLFSPDLKTFSFQHDQTIQFWKFDPQWLQ